MSAIKVRPFHRSDREQLTGLVNAHAGAVLPGMSVSASTVLSALERQPGEFIEDPWVSERLTLVAWQGDRIAAAAHLLRYFPDERAGASVRDAGEIHWLAFWPEAPAAHIGHTEVVYLARVSDLRPPPRLPSQTCARAARPG